MKIQTLPILPQTGWRQSFWRGLLPLLLAGLVPLGGATRARAASTPPEFMTYQGFLVDGNGNPLAPTTPANYPVIFRIYATATGNTRIWSEQQIVTVDKGSFSVVLGEGTPLGGESKPLLSSVFAGTTASDRYMGISVTIGGSTLEILPRLRLMPSPYSFLATSAANLIQPDGSSFLNYASGQINLSGRVGIGTGTAGRSLQVGDAGLANSEGMIRLASRSGAGGASRAWDIGVPETDENLSGAGYSFVIDDALTAGTEFMVKYGSGNVGIGTSTPGFPLTFANLLGDKISLYGQSGNNYGFGIQGGLLQIHTDAQSSDIAFGYGSSPLMFETMRIKGNGNLGIGTSTPLRRLHVNAADNVVARFDSTHAVGTWLALGNSSVGGRYWQFVSTGSANGEGAGKLLIGTGTTDSGTTVRMTVQNDGNVGIGTSFPASALQIGTTGGTGDSFIRMESIGGNVAANGIKLRNFNDQHGWDIINEERNGAGLQANGLHIIRHSNSAVGQSALFINKGTGFIGVGTTAPADQLHLRSGRLRIEDGGSRYIQMYRSANGLIITGNLTTQSGGNGVGTIQWDGDNNWDSLSDRRLKTDIEAAEPVMERLMELPVRRFRWKEGPEDAPKKFGVIAQEVEVLFPESVGSMTRPGTTEESLTVKYGTFGLLAVKALQELKAEKDAERTVYRKELGELRQKVERLEDKLAGTARVEALEQQVDDLKEMIRLLATVRKDAESPLTVDNVAELVSGPLSFGPSGDVTLPSIATR